MAVFARQIFPACQPAAPYSIDIVIYFCGIWFAREERKNAAAASANSPNENELTMENAITAGLSKQIVLSRALEITANNIANQTTAGFKAEQIAFREYITTIKNGPSGDPDVSLVYDPDSYTDFSSGDLQQTFADLDFAIDGEGFFGVETNQGLRYTRDGHFDVNIFGELVTRDGGRVLDSGGSPILIDPEAGPLSMTPEGELQQNGAPVATLGVFVFDDQRVLQRIGENLFEAFDDPATAANSRVRQGFIETSNVASISAVTDMIDIMRAYEQAAKIVEISDELARNAVSTLSERA